MPSLRSGALNNVMSTSNSVTDRPASARSDTSSSRSTAFVTASSAFQDWYSSRSKNSCRLALASDTSKPYLFFRQENTSTGRAAVFATVITFDGEDPETQAAGISHVEE